MAYKNKYNYRYIFISGCGMNCWKTISAAGFHFTKRKVVKCRHIFPPCSCPSDRLSLISVFSWPLISNFSFSYPLNSDFFLAPWNWTLIAVFCPPDFYFLFFSSSPDFCSGHCQSIVKLSSLTSAIGDKSWCQYNYNHINCYQST